ncbi:ABC transporter ATP-binding protein [Microbulbifer bruguierae]|uniref:ABC transporter ATP-binding protein n=1 Tax=Microbulbifer bruguierae TaxID=3029061 RepID=A0ABY8N998_9GAMM|nr:ABC transporter ATP-binding protein [Microbulbifer bruguierae]WGL15177.1 ABC transporter ATP-binding protein [Microbulbifer bruguierae]
MNTAEFRLSLRGITKQYPGCLANDAVSLDILPGAIYALLGENGAGKSTLMKIIYGVTQPDAGEILWEGERLQIPSPAAARRLGIGMVFQHFSLFETLTVLENIALGLEPAAAADRAALAQRIEQVSAKYGMPLNPQRPVHTLSTGERQRVEIVRCLVQDIRLLILDEPTSVLTPQEVETLFTTLRQLAAEGTSILFISHKLNEVKSLCDYATVLRHGRVSGQCRPPQESANSMARMMVGDETPVQHDGTRRAENTAGGEDFLTLDNFSLATNDPFGVTLKNISLSVKRGEIVGIAGVAGNGQSELMAALSGETLALASAGQLRFPEGDIGRLPPERRRAAGLACVPEDRLGQGAVPSMSLRENGLLTGFGLGLVRRGLLQFRAIDDFAQRVVEQFRVKCSGLDSAAGSLSGGNLQKFIIGREILQSPRCLIAAHPTWGVDIGAAISIHKALMALRDQGAAILVISEDIDELFTISDRIGAICDGRVSPLQATADTPLEQLGRWMAGVFDSEPAPVGNPAESPTGMEVPA